VLQKLEADSVSMRPKLRDLEFERNKRKGAAAGAGVSRSWYLAVDLWISGTTAHDEAAVHNPFAEDDEVRPGGGRVGACRQFTSNASTTVLVATDAQMSPKVQMGVAAVFEVLLPELRGLDQADL